MDGAQQLTAMFDRLTTVISLVGVGLVAPVLGWYGVQELLGQEGALEHGLRRVGKTLPFIVGPKVLSKAVLLVVRYVVGV